jgi:hypothetical protein
MPAPTHNENARKHGLYSGSIGKGNGWIRRACATFQVALEAAVIEARGEVSIRDAASIQTAIRWERHAQLAQKWLRLHPDMEPAELLKFSREVARASSERDKAIDSLQLQHDHRSAWDGVFDAPSLPVAKAPSSEDPPSPVTSADAKPTDDTNEPPCARDATPGATTNDISPEETDRW